MTVELHGTDDPENLCRLIADVAEAVGLGAVEDEAVAFLQKGFLLVYREQQFSRHDEPALFGRVAESAVAGFPARFDVEDHELQIVVSARGQKFLAQGTEIDLRTIRKAALGSYLMQVGRQPSVRVTRVR